MKKRLFFDLDGVLCEFKHGTPLKEIYKKGYFLDLKPQENIVEAFKSLNKDYECFILSSYLEDSKYALKEKREWVKKYLPECDKNHTLFVKCGQKKSLAIKDFNEDTDILVDDFTLNCNGWYGDYIKVSKNLEDLNLEKKRHKYVISPDSDPNYIKSVILKAVLKEETVYASEKDWFVAKINHKLFYFSGKEERIEIEEVCCISNDRIKFLTSPKQIVWLGIITKSVCSGLTSYGYTFWKKVDKDA